LEWLDRKGTGHHVASCPCWRCHLFRPIGLVSAGRLAEAESRFEPQSVKLSARLELPQPRKAAETAEALALRRRWLILGVVLVGSFMAVLDVFIVTQGLPSIRTTLGAGVSDLELVVSAYSLVYAVFLITGGRLGDILDRKRIFLFGMTVFTVASALAGYAPSAPFLVGARALQGLGAALMYPQVLSIIQVTFKGSERAIALGLFAAISGIGAITGNIVGGLLIQLNLAGLAWRPIFLVNVPIGIFGVLAGFLVLHPSRAERAPKLDLPGVGLISLFLVSLILPLAEGHQLGWPAWMILLLIASLPLLRWSKWALLHLRPVPTIRPRILTHRFRARIRRHQHRLHHSITPRPTTNPTIRQPPPEHRICLASSGSHLDNPHHQIFRDNPHPLRTSCSTHSIRTRRRLCTLTTTRNYSIGSPEPRRGSSLRRSLDFHADREHCRHLAVRTTLLPLPQ